MAFVHFRIHLHMNCVLPKLIKTLDSCCRAERLATDLNDHFSPPSFLLHTKHSQQLLQLLSSKRSLPDSLTASACSQGPTPGSRDPRWGAGTHATLIGRSQRAGIPLQQAPVSQYPLQKRAAAPAWPSPARCSPHTSLQVVKVQPVQKKERGIKKPNKTKQTNPKSPWGFPCTPSFQCHQSCCSKQLTPGHQRVTANSLKSKLDP